MRPGSKLRVGALRDGDAVVIETASSVYRFEVAAATRRAGALGGGRVGEAAPAALLGATSPSGAFSAEVVRRGDRVQFLVARGAGSSLVVSTSPVAAVRLLRRGAGRRRAA